MHLKALLLLLSTLLGMYAVSGHIHFRKSPASPLIKVLPGLPSTKNVGTGLWIAMITGDDRGIPKETKTIYYQLGLGHLFTPSGTHLAALSPLMRFIPKARFTFFPIALAGLFLPGFLALTRVAWMKGLSAHRKGLSFFCFFMIIEGVCYSWRVSPVSWLCSWLFLGLTYFAPRRTIVLWYLIGQMLLGWCFHQGFSLFTFPAALLLGIPLVLIFLPLFLASLVPWSILHGGLLWMLNCIHQGVVWVDTFHHIIPPLSLHAGHLMVGIALIMLPRQIKTHGLAALLVALSAPTGDWQIEKTQSSKWEIVAAPDAVITHVSYRPTHTLTSWSDGSSCRHQLVQGIWNENCRAKKHARQNKKFKKLSSLR